MSMAPNLASTAAAALSTCCGSATSVVSDEDAESETDQARCHAEVAAHLREPSLAVGKGRAHHQRDQHHSENRAGAEYREIRYRPAQVRNRAQHEQGNSGRPCQAMHDT